MLFQKKMLVWILLLVCWQYQLMGQFESDYSRLKPSGKIPAYLSIPFLEAYNPFDTRTENTDAPVTEDDFWQESNYYLNQLLISGKILYNDPVSKYIGQVADHLLRSHPELRRKLRFFAVKSPSLNAFSSNQGVILINVGLLARLENEAQLAFILSHEISHIISRHQMDFYLASREWETKLDQTTDKHSMRKMLMEQRKYSQETELEADQLGLKIFMASRYDLNAIPSCFDIIRQKDIAYDEKAFHPSFFDIPHVQYPDTFFLPSYDSIPEDILIFQQYNSTHPAAELRQKVLMDSITEKIEDFGGRSLFMSESADFYHIREICRFETCFSYLAHGDYEKSFYWSYLLLQKYPRNQFLKICLGQALYRLAKFKQVGKFWDIHTNFEQVSGKSRSLFYFFEQITPEALLTIALVYNWRLHIQYPSEEMLDHIIQDIMQELGHHYVDQLSYYHQNVNIDDVEDFHRYALAEALKYDEFVNKFSHQLGATADSSVHTGTSSSDPIQDVATTLEKGLNLGLDKIMIVDPVYYIVDDRLSRRKQLENAKRKQRQILHMIKEHATSLELNYGILTGNSIELEDTLAFEDLYLLNEWFNERNNQQGLDLVSIYYNEVQKLKEKYQTPHFVWIEAGNIAHSRSNKGLVLSAGILLPVLLPYSIIYTQTPKHMTFLYGIIYNLDTGMELAKYPKKVMMKDRMDVLNSITYDFIYQLKQSDN